MKNNNGDERARLAAYALCGIMSRPGTVDPKAFPHIAKTAVGVADAVLKELKK